MPAQWQRSPTDLRNYHLKKYKYLNFICILVIVFYFIISIEINGINTMYFTRLNQEYQSRSLKILFSGLL